MLRQIVSTGTEKMTGEPEKEGERKERKRDKDVLYVYVTPPQKECNLS